MAYYVPKVNASKQTDIATSYPTMDGNFINEIWTPHQYKWFHSPKKFVWLCGGSGSGKCLGEGTPVMMYNGSIKPVEGVKTGEYLMGENGTKRTVLSTTFGTDVLYKITPTKGDSFVCNSVHVLSLQDSTTKEKTDISLDKYLKVKNTKKYRNKLLYRSPIPEFNFYKDNAVPNSFLDPYFVGVWLGDENIRDPQITNGEPEILEYLDNYAKENNYIIKRWVDKRNKNIIYTRFNKPSRTTNKKGYPLENPLYAQLKNCINGRGKFITQRYLTSSYENRSKLLAGLIDTDGYLNRNCYYITTKYCDLKENILFLARSLGFGAYSKIKHAKIKSINFEGDYYRITITGDLNKIPCLVKRKQGNKRRQIKSVLRTGFSVEKLGTGKYYGFTLDGDGRFLLGDFTVTHNTWIGSRYAYYKILSNPETLGLIGANTYDQLSTSTVKPFFEFLNKVKMPFVVHRRPPASWGLKLNFSHYNNKMCFPNGKVILLRSFDNFETLEGLTLGWAWIDETRQSNPAVWDILLRRLRCNQSHKLEMKVTSTPNGRDWVYEEFQKSNKYQIIFMSACENPHLPKEYILDMLASYDPELAKQEVHGRIVEHGRARTYHQFQPHLHVMDRWEYDPDRPIIMGWDFNYGDAPMAVALHQEFYNPLTRVSEVQVIDEVVMVNSDTPTIMNAVLKRYGKTNNIHRGGWEIYGDAYGNRGTTGKSDYQIIKEMLCKVFPSHMVILKVARSNPGEIDRINAMNRLMCNTQNVVRYYVSPKCKALIRDFQKVTCTTNGSIEKHTLDKTLSHISDGSGYFIARRYAVVKKKMGSMNLDI